MHFQPANLLLWTSIVLLPAFRAAGEEPMTRNETTVVLDATAVANLGIETAEAEESGFTRSSRVFGEIQAASHRRAVVSSRVAGRVIEVAAVLGDLVTEGQLVARIESRQAGNPPPVIELRAPAAGRVVRSGLHPGTPVEPDRELMEIQDLSTVWAVAKIPQQQAAVLMLRPSARISVPAVGDAELSAEFLRLGEQADAGIGTVDAIFAIPNSNDRLRPGMRAVISLITSQREGVLSIPRAALQGDRSNRFVFIKDYELENAFVRIPVVIGEMNAERVEITAGLFPGDEVVTRGSYSLAFAGKGNASLKEALDAAHGHPHNEDGTEMTDAQLAEASAGHGHDHGDSRYGGLVLPLAIACGVLTLLLAASQFQNLRMRRNA
jgi:multidrug efflux pump subunit AcrA (membrane-fusion protein)